MELSCWIDQFITLEANDVRCYTHISNVMPIFQCLLSVRPLFKWWPRMLHVTHILILFLHTHIIIYSCILIKGISYHQSFFKVEDITSSRYEKTCQTGIKRRKNVSCSVGNGPCRWKNLSSYHKLINSKGICWYK